MFRRWYVTAGILVFAAASSAGEALRFNRGPYLLHLTGTSVTIIFETDEASGAEVRYGTGEKPDRTLAVEPVPFDYKALKEGAVKESTRGWLKEEMLVDRKAFEYRAEIKDLAPGCAYRYVVRVGEAETGPIPFRTVPENAGKFAFIVYGDSRSQPEIHRRVASQFLRHDPAFILHVGDYTDSGGYVFWNEEYFAPLRGVIDRVPLWPTQGDHEGRDAYRRAFGLPADAARDYSFDYGNVHVVSMNNAFGTLDEKRLSWLEKDLSAAKTTWRIAFYHKPQYDIAPFYRAGLDIAFAGHQHNYQRYLPRTLEGSPGHAVTYVVTGGGGAPLKGISRKPENCAVAEARYHYTVVEVDGSRITLTAIDQDGKEFDRVSWSKQAADSILDRKRAE